MTFEDVNQWMVKALSIRQHTRHELDWVVPLTVSGVSLPQIGSFGT
jgi:hypothetical protein